mmetsp:Transcript_71258/g.158396  ORF Transcript_71258/g.158396 Transcript_71258/m.158396 type:complete len:389 (-) Transcript_71258:473-1639(-)
MTRRHGSGSEGRCSVNPSFHSKIGLDPSRSRPPISFREFCTVLLLCPLWYISIPCSRSSLAGRSMCSFTLGLQIWLLLTTFTASHSATFRRYSRFWGGEEAERICVSCGMPKDARLIRARGVRCPASSPSTASRGVSSLQLFAFSSPPDSMPREKIRFSCMRGALESMHVLPLLGADAGELTKLSQNVMPRGEGGPVDESSDVLRSPVDFPLDFPLLPPSDAAEQSSVSSDAEQLVLPPPPVQSCTLRGVKSFTDLRRARAVRTLMFFDEASWSPPLALRLLSAAAKGSALTHASSMTCLRCFFISDWNRRWCTSRFASTNDSVTIAMMIVASSQVDSNVNVSSNTTAVTGSSSYHSVGFHTAESPRVTMYIVWAIDENSRKYMPSVK